LPLHFVPVWCMACTGTCTAIVVGGWAGAWDGPNLERQDDCCAEGCDLFLQVKVVHHIDINRPVVVQRIGINHPVVEDVVPSIS
jgi:hypothetical protein